MPSNATSKAAGRKRRASAEGAHTEKLRVRRLIRRLKKEYPAAQTALEHTNPFELLVATILSAQCTDERVNRVTPELFARFPDAASLARADLPELEAIIRSTGFFRNKAKNLIACAQGIVARHGGRVPDTMEELTALGGVGRKTANVVLGNALDRPVGIVVDTHVKRLSGLLGLSRFTDPEKIERDLMELVPRRDWTVFSHLLILHGRAVCIARRPRCEICVVNADCPGRKAAPKPGRKPRRR